MMAHSTPPIRDTGTDDDADQPETTHSGAALPDAGPLDTAPDTAEGPYEPVHPAEAPRRQMRTLAPSPARLTIIGGGVVAVLAGGAVGYWLGKRRVRQSPRPFRRAATTVDTVADLAPVAVRALANPIVRALVVRMLLRQLNRRIAR